MKVMQIVLGATMSWALCAVGASAHDRAGHFKLNADGSRDCTQLLASGNPDYPPYLWVSKDGKSLEGAAADFLTQVGARAGVDIQVIHAGNWGRVQQNMRDGTLDLIAGAFFTLPRLEYMDYFHPPFQGTRTVIWTRENLDLGYRQWSDLHGLEGLTVINNSFGQAFDIYADANLTITEVPSLSQGLGMLARDRAEYLIYEEFPGKAFAAREGITGIRSYDTPVSEEQLHLTMSQQSACNTGELRGRIARAVFELVTEEAMTEMLEANVKRWGENTN